jgi:hypothetical protein
LKLAAPTLGFGSVQNVDACNRHTNNRTEVIAALASSISSFKTYLKALVTLIIALYAFSSSIIG